MDAFEVIPSARCLIKSLRDMGYDFTQAVADVIDNSMPPKRATLVAIDIEFDGDDSWVRIADNGSGMKPDALREALRFGSDRAYKDDDLGKFGLGLKTASLSQCQCLSVASRWNPDRADVAAYAWDLDHIQKTDRWEIVPVDRDAVGPSIRNVLKDGPGTVVLWHRLDRLLGYKHPYGEAARKRLQEMCRDLELHLGMVFERFLSTKSKGKRLEDFVKWQSSTSMGSILSFGDEDQSTSVDGTTDQLRGYIWQSSNRTFRSSSPRRLLDPRRFSAREWPC